MPRQRSIQPTLLPLVADWYHGRASSVCFVVTYANAADMPSVQWLKGRILKLHEWYPFMTATFEEDAMLQETSTADIDYDWLIQETSIEEGKAEARRIRAGGGISDDDDAPDVLYLLEWETQRWMRDSRIGKPMWQVIRYLPTEGQDTRAYLAVTVSHTLADGIGCQEAVMALVEPDDVFHQRPKEDFFAMDLDAPTTVRGISTLKRMSHPAEEGPKTTTMPAAVQAVGSVAPQEWPKVAMPLEKEAKYATLGYARGEVSTGVIQTLRDRGKTLGVATITPIVTLAFLHAVASVYVPRHLSASEEQFSLTGLVSASDRENLEGPSAIFGAYFNGFKEQYLFPPNAAQSFWDLARVISQNIRNPAKWHIGRQGRADQPSKSRLETIKGEGMEKLCGGLNPPWRALGYSSLGYVSLPPRSIDYDWLADFPPVHYQSMVGFGTGNEKGTRLCLGWAEGAVCTHKEQRKVLRRWLHILNRLADGEDLLSRLLEE